jgi:formylmethanofuran dehydrogenase subunit E
MEYDADEIRAIDALASEIHRHREAIAQLEHAVNVTCGRARASMLYARRNQHEDTLHYVYAELFKVVTEEAARVREPKSVPRASCVLCDTPTTHRTDGGKGGRPLCVDCMGYAANHLERLGKR